MPTVIIMASKGALLAFFFVTVTIAAEVLPTGWKVCKRSGPDLNACLKGAVLAVINSLINGNEKLGLPKLDPLFTKSMTFSDSGQGGPVRMKAVFKNYTVSGLRAVEVQDIDFDVKNSMIATKLHAPVLLIDGKYEMSGKILKLHLTGNGHVSLKLHDVIITSTVELGMVEKNRAEYFKVKKFLMNLTTSKAENRFDNLFNGDKKLGDQMNNLLNENAEQIFREVGPSINEAYTKSFAPVIKTIFETFPMNVISPP